MYPPRSRRPFCILNGDWKVKTYSSSLSTYNDLATKACVTIKWTLYWVFGPRGRSRLGPWTYWQRQHTTYGDKEATLERYWNCMFHSRWHFCSWWRHQMETFSALLALCAGNSPVSGEFPSQRPVTRSFDVFFDLGLNNPLSKQLWGWWFDTPSRCLWRHCNVLYMGHREHMTKCHNNEAIGN